MQNASANRTLQDFFDCLRVAPASVLMLDYDGTLAPFQLERDCAYPYPEVVPILERIVRLGKTRVAVITGRPVGDMKRLLGPLNNIEIWGSHGLERMLPDGTYWQMNMGKETTDVLSHAEEWVTAAGLTSRAEIKPGGIAIHWRGMSSAKMADIEARIREGWTALAERLGFKLLQFDGGLELRVAHPDKGDAVAAILEDSDPAAQIAYLGDDFTDEDAFRVLSDCGLTVLVRTEYRKTLASVWLKPPQELISFLDQWLNRISV
ncbi:MAG: trehalose-phosphatase [Alloacidobacterium sp.]